MTVAHKAIFRFLVIVFSLANCGILWATDAFDQAAPHPLSFFNVALNEVQESMQSLRRWIPHHRVQNRILFMDVNLNCGGGSYFIEVNSRVTTNEDFHTRLDSLDYWKCHRHLGQLRIVWSIPINFPIPSAAKEEDLVVGYIARPEQFSAVKFESTWTSAHLELTYKNGNLRLGIQGRNEADTFSAEMSQESIQGVLRRKLVLRTIQPNSGPEFQLQHYHLVAERRSFDGNFIERYFIDGVPKPLNEFYSVSRLFTISFIRPISANLIVMPEDFVEFLANKKKPRN